jgi:hypothetical protein
MFWVASAVLAYYFVGLYHVVRDFNELPLNRPFYALKPSPLKTLYALLFWFRRLPAGLALVSLIWCGAVMAALLWALGLLVDDIGIRTSIIGGLLILASLPFILTRRV